MPLLVGVRIDHRLVPACRKKRLKGTCSRAAATTILGVGAGNHNGRNSYTLNSSQQIRELYNWWLHCDTEGKGRPPYKLSQEIAIT